MRAVRVGQITRDVDDLRLHAIEQLANDAYVIGTDRVLPDLAGLVERQVQEDAALAADADGLDAADGLRLADDALHVLHFRDVDLAGLLGRERSQDALRDDVVLAAPVLQDVTEEALQEIDVAAHLVIEHGD